MLRKNKKEEMMKLVLRAHETMKEVPEFEINDLKLFSEKELENMLDEYEIILALYADISSKFIKILSDEVMKEEKITVKKINLDDLFNSL